MITQCKSLKVRYDTTYIYDRFSVITYAYLLLWIVKNTCYNYREFGLEDYLWRIPHTWHLLLKLVWRELDIMAMKNWKKIYLSVPRGHELESALYVLFTLSPSHALLKKHFLYSFTLVLTPQLSVRYAIISRNFNEHTTKPISLLSFDKKVQFPTRHRALLNHGHLNHPSIFATRKRVRRRTYLSFIYHLSYQLSELCLKYTPRSTTRISSYSLVEWQINET